MDKVLIVTYYWPPAGGAGVQRWLKFSKYLLHYGYEPVILTVDPHYATYPALDLTLGKDIPKELKIYRVKATDWFRLYKKDKSKVPSAGFAGNNNNTFFTKISRFLRGNFFIPDPRKGWNRFAIKAALEIIRKEKIHTIITTSPPHSSQLIGLKIKRKIPSLFWVSDLRDSWTDIYYYELFYPTPISKMIDRHYEKSVLQTADRIITVGNNLADSFASKAAGINEKIRVIPNGFDEEDFEKISKCDPKRFTVTYTGTISESYPLNSLLKALQRLEKEGKDFVLRFVGYVPENVRSKIASQINPDKVVFIPYTDHGKAVDFMCNSSVLLLLIPSHKNNEAITPGKTFEYLAAGKPVLYIGPLNGDAAFHLKQCGHKGLFDVKDEEGIYSYINGLMIKKETDRFVTHPEYSRRALTGKISAVLRETDLLSAKM